ncbi:hypothetical protein F4824DRAFT_444825, partial [Ustulina deusta]
MNLLRKSTLVSLLLLLQKLMMRLHKLRLKQSGLPEKPRKLLYERQKNMRRAKQKNKLHVKQKKPRAKQKKLPKPHARLRNRLSASDGRPKLLHLLKRSRRRAPNLMTRNPNLTTRNLNLAARKRRRTTTNLIL